MEAVKLSFRCDIKMYLEFSYKTVVSLPAQEFVNVRPGCMDPSVTNAIRVSSTSAALGVDHVTVTTTPATAIHNLVSW